MAASKAQKRALEQLVIREWNHLQSPDTIAFRMTMDRFNRKMRSSNITGATMKALINKGYILVDDSADKDREFHYNYPIELTDEARQIGINQLQEDAHTTMEYAFKRRDRDARNQDIAFDVMCALEIEWADVVVEPRMQYGIAGFKITGISKDDLVSLFISYTSRFGLSTKTINSETRLPAVIDTPKFMLQIAADLEQVARAAALAETVLTAMTTS